MRFPSFLVALVVILSLPRALALEAMSLRASTNIDDRREEDPDFSQRLGLLWRFENAWREVKSAMMAAHKSDTPFQCRQLRRFRDSVNAHWSDIEPAGEISEDLRKKGIFDFSRSWEPHKSVLEEGLLTKPKQSEIGHALDANEKHGDVTEIIKRFSVLKDIADETMPSLSDAKSDTTPLAVSGTCGHAARELYFKMKEFVRTYSRIMEDLNDYDKFLSTYFARQLGKVDHLNQGNSCKETPLGIP